MSGEMKRMLTSKNFLAAWLIACAALLFGQTYPSLKKPLTCGAFIDLLDSAIKGQIVSFILPIAAVLTWSDSFLQEYRSGFLKTALPRTSRSQYVEGKVFSILMSGFLVWLLAVITVLWVNFVIFYPMEVKGNIPKDLLTKLLMKALRMSILGGIISTLGGICGTLCQSAYMAYGIPFISYYFGIILHQRYFKEQLWFYPPEWITPSGNWGPYQTGLWLFLLLFLLVLIPVLGSVLYDKIEEI